MKHSRSHLGDRNKCTEDQKMVEHLLCLKADFPGENLDLGPARCAYKAHIKKLEDGAKIFQQQLQIIQR